MMKKISVAIPSYEFGGRGAEVLEHSFKILSFQDFQDFDVVVADHSNPKNMDIEELCSKWGNWIDIKYYRNLNNVGNAASNFNFAIQHSEGEYIKLLCQDDCLFSNSALSAIMMAINNSSANWLASAYWHADGDKDNLSRPHHPFMNPQIYIVNTLGTPSGITIKNFGKEIPLFDSELSYCYDCDFYYRFFKKYGEPRILKVITAINLRWEKSTTSSITQEIIQKENRYILNKYGFLQ